MPDQPPDPIHYDMKIPPEPQKPKNEDEGSNAESAKPEEQGSDKAEDTSAKRQEDKPQADRGGA